MDAYEADPKNRPVIIPLSESISGVNSEIGFARRSQSLYFMASYAELEFLPLPHRNTVTLEKCKDRHNYVLSQRIDNFFMALDREDNFTIWDMTTGQLIHQSFNERFEGSTLPNKGFSLIGYNTWTGMATNKCYSGIKIPENEYITNEDDVAAPTGEFMEDVDDNETSKVMPSFYA
jgi:hypothetical protein